MFSKGKNRSGKSEYATVQIIDGDIVFKDDPRFEKNDRAIVRVTMSDCVATEEHIILSGRQSSGKKTPRKGGTVRVKVK